MSSLNIPDTIINVNNKLKNGYSIAKIERELNFGKDTLRKKLNRANYWYDKNLNQFILGYNTDATQNTTHTEQKENECIKRHTEIKAITNNIAPNTTYNTLYKNNISVNNTNQTQDTTLTEKQPITQAGNTILTQEKSQRVFTDEDFNVLFEMIDNYKIKKNNINIPKENSEVVTRSFRSYKSIFDMFAKYCKDNELNQKDAIAEALISYISK